MRHAQPVCQSQHNYICRSMVLMETLLLWQLPSPLRQPLLFSQKRCKIVTKLRRTTKKKLCMDCTIVVFCEWRHCRCVYMSVGWRDISDERDTVQKKTFTKWVNKHLIRVSLHCHGNCLCNSKWVRTAEMYYVLLVKWCTVEMSLIVQPVTKGGLQEHRSMIEVV